MVAGPKWPRPSVRQEHKARGRRGRSRRKLRRERERKRQWEEWRRETLEKEEAERANILQSHLDSQKVRMIKEGSMEVGGSRKSPAVTSATSAASVAPVQAMTLGDIVPSGTVRQKAALRQKITQRMQTEVSEFEAERRKAANKVKKRIEAQVIQD